MAAKKEKKKCFLISPIGEDNSPTRTRADFLLEFIIKPVLEEKKFDYDVERSDGNYLPGIIDTQIFKSISNCDLIIANLTELNANVFYELGIAHSLGRPVVLMAEKDVKVPFDTATNRVIFYNTENVQGYDVARIDLAKAVKAVEANDYIVENPFTRFLGRSVELAGATPVDKQVMAFLELVPNLVARLERLESKPGYTGPETLGGYLGGGLRSGGIPPWSAKSLLSQTTEESERYRLAGALGDLESKIDDENLRAVAEAEARADLGDILAVAKKVREGAKKAEDQGNLSESDDPE